jgi:membrane protease YdiL (CAAX protease family)
MQTAAIRSPEHAGRGAVALGAALLPFLLLSLVDGWYKGRLHDHSPLAFWMADAAKFVFVPLVSLWLLRRLAGIGPSGYGLALPRGAARGSLAAETLVATVLLWAGYSLAEGLAARLLPGAPADAFGYDAALPGGGLARAAGTLYLAITAALAEEVMLRGVLRAWVERVVAPPRRATVFVLASATLFALVHWENGAAELVAAAVYGLIAASLCLRMGSLWPLVAAHFLIDLVAFR